jgi:type IV secretory pathway protease TraF
MTPSASSIVLTGLGAALAIASLLVEPRPILVWNATASAPRGLYCIAPLTRISQRGRCIGALDLRKSN